MTREKKITRHTIESGEPQPFIFLGVVSAEPDYRLSVMINRHLGTNLRKCREEIIISSASTTSSFARFTTDDLAFTLVSNRNSGNFLLRKLKNIDFIIIPGRTPDLNATEKLLSSLREIPEITAVFLFNSRDYNDRNLSLLLF
jgi:hypothetical protein